MASRYMHEPVLGRTKLNREHLQLWDAFFSTALQMERRISEDVLLRIHAGLLEADDEIGIQELVLQKQERVSEHNKKIVQSLWQLYDTNGDRELDQDEIQLVILDSLTSLSKWMPLYVRQLHEASMKTIRHKYSAAQMKELNDLMKVFMEQSEDLVQQYLQEKLRNLVDVIGKVWRHLDADNSGIIKQSEFIDNYSHAITAVLDPEELKVMLEKLWLGDQVDDLNNENSYSESLASATALLNASPSARGDGAVLTSGSVLGGRQQEQQQAAAANTILASKRRRRGLAALSPWKRRLLKVLPCVATLVPGGTVALQEENAEQLQELKKRKATVSGRSRGGSRVYNDDDDDIDRVSVASSGGSGSRRHSRQNSLLSGSSLNSPRRQASLERRGTHRRRASSRQLERSPTHRRRGSRDSGDSRLQRSPTHRRTASRSQLKRQATRSRRSSRDLQRRPSRANSLSRKPSHRRVPSQRKL